MEGVKEALLVRRGERYEMPPASYKLSCTWLLKAGSQLISHFPFADLLGHFDVIFAWNIDEVHCRFIIPFQTLFTYVLVLSKCSASHMRIGYALALTWWFFRSKILTLRPEHTYIQQTVPVLLWIRPVLFYPDIGVTNFVLPSFKLQLPRKVIKFAIIKSYFALQEVLVEKAREGLEVSTMAELVPDNLIQPEQEASCSDKMPGDMRQPEQAEAASSSTKLADMEKTLSKISMLECLQALFQLNPSLAQRDVGSGDALDMAETSNTIPNAVLFKYFRILDERIIEAYGVLGSVKEMVDEHPQLLMEVSPTYHRTYLHISVIANSEVQVRKLLRMMLANKDIAYSSNSRKSHLSKNAEFLGIVESLSGFNAFQMACVVGNGKIVDMIEDYHEAVDSCSGKIPASLDASSEDESDDEEAEDSQPLTEELKQQKVHTRRIGEVLTSYLDPLGFSRVPLEAMSLGDEFKLHSSLIVEISSIQSWDEYSQRASNNIEKLLGSIVSKLAEESLLSTFLALRDNADRNILHYLVDFLGYYEDAGSGVDSVSSSIFTTLMRELDLVPELDMNVKDSLGRTPLHLAAAQGYTKVVEHFAKDVRTDLNATYNMSAPGIDQDREILDVEGISALSLAATHNHFEVVKRLLDAPRCTRGEFEPLDVNLRIETVLPWSSNFYNEYYSLRWTPFQVAAFKGHVQTLELLLSDDRLHDFGLISQSKTPYDQQFEYGFDNDPALSLAALGSKPYAVKTLLKSDKIDPFATDYSIGNTALHSALLSIQIGENRGPWDFVNVSMCTLNPKKYALKLKNSGEMIGCIDLLLQAGLDMDQRNKRGNTPQLRPETPIDVQQWWYDKLAKDAIVTKNNVVAASNAISVTSALVAATSFVGPLQPPLGLSSNNDAENMWLFGYSQVNHVGVDMFLFFDSLSFYLAIASIMLALIPSLPTQQHEGLFLEVKRAQRNLQGAIALLFASITFLICTFSAASVAILPKARWKYKSIIVCTSIFGGIICFIVLILFVRRLWRLIKPKRHSCCRNMKNSEQ